MNPPAERSSQNFPDQPEWDCIAASSQFQDLMDRKKAFILPAFLFFLVYYLLLPILIGYAPKLMSTRVFGTLSLAYVFALSQFIVGWVIAGLYLRASARFDRLIKDLPTKVDAPDGGS
jgi:uncharacterized membrane protein (DUF485 family)